MSDQIVHLINRFESRCRIERHPWLCKLLQCSIGVVLGNAVVLAIFFKLAELGAQ